MSRTDQRIREEIRRLADPPDPAGALDRVERLVARRAVVRRAQTAGLAVLVVAGSVLGVLGLIRLFGGPTIPSAPNAPEEEMIVFHQASGGNLDLFAVRPDGSGRQRLTDSPAADVYPALSPDGSRLAFASDRTGHLEIHVMPAEGGPATALTKGSAESYDPAWSPDGTRIAFGSNRAGNDAIYVMDADGSNVTPLTNADLDPVLGFVGSPDWSPDGRRIAFVAQRADEPQVPESGGNVDIYVMDADGSNVLRVTEDPRDDWDPAWSPDGSRIAFHSSRGDASSDIYVVRPDGSGLMRLTDGPGADIQPAWSPVGSRIVFASELGGTLGLFVMNADGSNVAPLVNGEAAGPAWGRAAEAAGRDETGTPDETPPPDETPAGACDESTVRGDFDGDGREDAATVLRARCSVLTEPAEWAVELDWNGPTGAWPLTECVEWCRALGAPDVNGDGRAELAVVVQGGSVQRFALYAALPREPGPAPLLVAPPGDPRGGFDPDAPALFWIGGDEWWTYNVRCDREDVAPVLVVTAAESLPHDDPEAQWHMHETILRLTGATPQDAADPSDGLLEVISTMDYISSFGSPDDDHLFTDGMLCGERLNLGGVAGGS